MDSTAEDDQAARLDREQALMHELAEVVERIFVDHPDLVEKPAPRGQRVFDFSTRRADAHVVEMYGPIRIVVRAAPAPRPASARTPRARPRERRSVRRARARSPGSKDDGSEPPGLAARDCEHCGEMFKPSREAQRFCKKDECRRAKHAEHGRDYRARLHCPIPANLAELSWEAAQGDGLLALGAALAVVARLEAAA